MGGRTIKILSAPISIGLLVSLFIKLLYAPGGMILPAIYIGGIVIIAILAGCALFSFRFIAASSTYIIVSALVSSYFILLAITQAELGILKILVALVDAAIVGLVLFNNASILRAPETHTRKRFLINLILCAAQSISIFSNGFYYKLCLGFEWVLFIHMDYSTRSVDWGAFPKLFVHDFILNFKSSTGLLTGTNLITLALGIFYYKLLRSSKNLVKVI